MRMNCPACHTERHSLVYQLPLYRVVRCDQCGLMYNGDFPDDDKVAETFSESYYHDVQKDAFARISDPLNDQIGRAHV